VKLADIVLDVNAFRVFANEESSKRFVDKIIEKCHHIYVLHNIVDQIIYVFKKSLFLQLLSGPLKRLRRNNKYHEEPKSSIEREELPPSIEEELEKYHANSYDRNLAMLALRRRKKGQEVYLVSKDSCFLNNKELFKSHGIEVVDWEELIAILNS
jgi:predicted nucleic acid-binding protein